MLHIQAGDAAQSIECEPRISSPPAKGRAGREWGLKLAQLGRLSDDQLAAVDIAELNLLAAEGLPGTENLDPNAFLKKIDDWTGQVRRFTEDNAHQLLKFPGRYASPGDFKILAMFTVVARDLGARYNMAFSEGDYNPSDPRNLFLHGMLTGHGGTCVTMPLLYIAIGRQLGYPLHLVMAKEHFFVRWEDSQERFNIEATSFGFTPRTDDDYRVEPKPLTPTDIAQGVYLRNLNPREVLASFLSERAVCLLYNLRTPEALSAYERAAAITTKLPGIFMGRLACSALMDGILQAERGALAAGRATIDLRQLKLPSPLDDEKRRVNAMALEKLHAVILLGTADPVISLPI